MMMLWHANVRVLSAAAADRGGIPVERENSSALPWSQIEAAVPGWQALVDGGATVVVEILPSWTPSVWLGAPGGVTFRYQAEMEAMGTDAILTKERADAGPPITWRLRVTEALGRKAEEQETSEWVVAPWSAVFRELDIHQRGVLAGIPKVARLEPDPSVSIILFAGPTPGWAPAIRCCGKPLAEQLAERVAAMAAHHAKAAKGVAEQQALDAQRFRAAQGRAAVARAAMAAAGLDIGSIGPRLSLLRAGVERPMPMIEPALAGHVILEDEVYDSILKVCGFPADWKPEEKRP